MLSAGSDVGGRFRVERNLHSYSSGCVYAARDLRTQKPVTIWLIPKQLASEPALFEELRTGIRLATEVSSEYVVPTLGIVPHDDGSMIVARSSVAGATLFELARAKSRLVKTFSPRGAFPVLSSVAGALTAAQPRMAHGALTAESVMITPNGMIQVADFGLAVLLARLESFATGPARPYVAPEVLAGERPTARSDVYSLGALLYLLLCGVAPKQGGTPAPSLLQPLLPAAVDEIVARCMQDDPKARPADASTVRAQVLAAVEAWSAPPKTRGEEWPFDDTLTLPAEGGKTTMELVEPVIDVALDSIPAPSEPPVTEEMVMLDSIMPEPDTAAPKLVPAPVARPAVSPPASSPRPPPPPPAPPSARPPGPSNGRNAGATTTGDMFETALASSARPEASPGNGNGSGAPLPVLASPSPNDQIDLNSLLSNVTQTENQIWMVQRDKLDHGPFSTRELGQQIFAGQVSGDDQVLNMDTGVRQRAVIWPEFSQIVAKALEQRRKEQELQALKKVETVEKGVSVVWYFVAAGIVVSLGIIVSFYFVYRNAARDRSIRDHEVADLFTTTGQRINTGAGILPMEKGAGGGRRGKRRPGAGGRGGMTAEEAMTQGVDYGNLEGAMTTLSVGQVTSVMNRNVRSLAGCMGGATGRVTLDIVINGDGSVAGVSVNAPADGVRSCISSRAQSIRFPSFSSPRMRASYYFEVGP